MRSLRHCDLYSHEKPRDLRLLRPLRRVFLPVAALEPFLYVSLAALMTCDRPPFFLYVPLRFMSAIVDFT